MNGRSRVALVSSLLALACSSPSSGLFSPVEGGPSPSAGSGGSAGTTSGGSGSGAISGGGTGMVAGEGMGAMPAAGTAGTGQQMGEGGSDGEPMTGLGGADAGAGGVPSDPPDPPMCGNGKLEGDEECDDMGQEGNDGCNANCEVDCEDFGEDAIESADHHCYQGYDEGTFEEAQADCVERGAHLVTISSAAENEIVASFVANSKFIGGFEMVDEMDDSAGTYEWVTGEPFTYENWDEDQPDQDPTRCGGGFTGPFCYSHCAAMDGDGVWNDQRCDREDGYVCEWEPAGS